MTTKRRTELAHRTCDGIDVYLLWDEATDRVTVVLDARTDGGFEVEVDGRHALDAFNHPYAYGSRAGATRRQPVGTTDWWETDRARTSR